MDKLALLEILAKQGAQVSQALKEPLEVQATLEPLEL